MNEYFDGAVNQLLERGRRLILMIPTGLPREFHLLEQTCRDRLTNKLDELRQLVTDEVWFNAENQPERLRQFKRLVRDLDILETVCIAALERASNADLHLNRLVERIRQEIAYPLLPPVVTPLSQAYFQTWPDFHLMLVPLSEGNFLLHLPDIYHELAHPLFQEKYDQRIAPFLNAFHEVIDAVTLYTEAELEKEKRRGGPEPFSDYLEIWLICWLKGWAEEFFCDLFAVYTLGPAFVWSHLHLTATRGDEPYKVPVGLRVTTHPPDGARIAAMLDGLALIGFGTEAIEIEEQWNRLAATAQSRPEAEYHRCFPRQIIKLLTEKALEGVTGMKCRVARSETNDYVHGVFNQAWKEFWSNPNKYVVWEKQAVEVLRQECLKP
ncbi:MAG: hypothetical protein MOB07_02765 [Acidobacteria bacterium]|nr:hypothetical protein [Acidobacteriota bacterium]